MMDCAEISLLGEMAKNRDRLRSYGVPEGYRAVQERESLAGVRSLLL
jgi:hypothetical protein